MPLKKIFKYYFSFPWRNCSFQDYLSTPAFSRAVSLKFTCDSLTDIFKCIFLLTTLWYSDNKITVGPRDICFAKHAVLPKEFEAGDTQTTLRETLIKDER